MKRAIAAFALVVGVATLLFAQSISFLAGKASFTSQTSGFSATTLFTPSADRDYIFSMYTQMTGPADGSYAVPVLGWTDAYGSTSNSFTSANAGGGIGQSVFTIHAVGGQPVTLSSSVSNIGGSHSYNYYLTWVAQ